MKKDWEEEKSHKSGGSRSVMTADKDDRESFADKSVSDEDAEDDDDDPVDVAIKS